MLIKCEICASHYCNWRAHCPDCGARKITTWLYVDFGHLEPKQIARGNDGWREKLVGIVRVSE